MFLSHLNEISGACEKILLVSGSFWSKLNFFKDDAFDCVVWVVSEGEWNSLVLFCDFCSDEGLSICCARFWPVLTTELQF